MLIWVIVMENEELLNRIQDLRDEKKAVILAHNYQRPEIQDMADFVGDSLELSLCATETPAEIIVFCGVNFMAETAAILNPEKKVLLPDRHAVCPMAAMLPAETIQFYRQQYPGADVVLYINSLAEAKAQCDAVCTSANSNTIIDAMDSDTVLFGPDSNLAEYAREYTDKEVIAIPRSGFCPVHKLFSEEGLRQLRKDHPDAEILAHPECNAEAWKAADFVGSTSKMFGRSLSSEAEKFAVATEVGLLHRMRKERPKAEFIPAYAEAVCTAMKLHTLEKVLSALEQERYEVRPSPEIMKAAKKPVDFMLEYRESLD